MTPALLRFVLLAAAVAGLVTLAPAEATTGQPALFNITITRVSPTTLTSGHDLRISGTVTNTDSHAWTDLQVYLALPTQPWTTRSQLDTALATQQPLVGSHQVGPAHITTIKALMAGDRASFDIRVPWKALGLSGASGVYPVDVQLVGTAPDGSRSPAPVAHTTTFVPLIPKLVRPVATTVVWSFTLADYRDSANVYPHARQLARSMGGGQLRHLLDLALRTPARMSTVLLDPALLDAAADLAADRHSALRQSDHAAAKTFLTDLERLARRDATWVLGYGNPDELALTQNSDMGPSLRATIDLATQRAMETHHLTGRRVTQLGPGSASAQALAELRGGGDRPVIVNAADLSGWPRTAGSLISQQTAKGRIPLLVDDGFVTTLGGGQTGAVLAQAVLADAALAALDEHRNRVSQANSVTIVPPTFDPGRDASSVAAVVRSSFVAGRTLDSLLTDNPAPITATVAQPTATAVSPATLAAASRLASRSRAAVRLAGNDPGFAASLAQDVALQTSVYWRGRTAEAEAAVYGRIRTLSARLARLTIEGPPSFTLSGTSGRFPLTITNRTPYSVKVGVRIDSSNPALSIRDVAPTTIGAGERLTLTVPVNVKAQKSSSVTATLVDVKGQAVGKPAEFNLRSSNVDALVWIAMAVAAGLAFGTIGRRIFSRRRPPLDPT